MRGTSFGLGWVAGICIAQQWPQLPSKGWLLGALLLSFCILLISQRIRCARPLLFAMAFLLLAMLWVAIRAQGRIDERLLPSEDDRVTRVNVLVSDLPAKSENAVRFVGELQEPVPEGLPLRVMVFWPSACTGDCLDSVEPGQVWRMALRFRQPVGRLNFAGFDTEGWLFQQGIRASATVRGEPTRLKDLQGWQPMIWIEKVRSHIRRRLHRLLADKQEAQVLVALAIGDQQGVSAQDWEIFNLSGITHLVSISGSHVTLIAALGAAGMTAFYRRLRWRGRWLMERWPSRLIFVWSAGSLAFVYCLLAGWGVPAQRTFFMLVAAALAFCGRVPISGAQAIVGAAVVMTLLDPWSALSTGFWLSFGAMSLLVLLAQDAGQSARQTAQRWQAWIVGLWIAARMQWIMTIASVPVSVYLFQQVSFAGLPANAWAIPWITFVATPLALLLSGLCLLPLPDVWLLPMAWVAHESLALSLAPVRWLATFPWLSLEVSAIDFVTLLICLLALPLGLCLPPIRCRPMAWFLILPALCTRPSGMANGQWQITAFDVGQGGALLVRTGSQAVLFDTGWRYGSSNAVERIILPELRAMGVTHLDQVIISHPDNDHVGGLQALQAKRSIGRLIGSGLQTPEVLACKSGQSWVADGVRFEIVHPLDDCAQQQLSGLLRNRCGCVLSVRGKWHSALLTGDIDAVAETGLLATMHSTYDVTTMSHHGSRTSSSLAWVFGVHASHALAQAGHYNRFSHPHREVVQRWQTAGAKTWVSSADGAVRFESSEDGLVAVSSRDSRRRYWHQTQLLAIK